MKCFSSCQKFNRVQVWRFGKCNPLVDVFFHEGFGSTAGVFGVIVLKPKAMWESMADKWSESLSLRIQHP